MTPTDDGSDKKGFSVNDRRWWLQDDVDLDELAGQAVDRKPTYVEELEGRLQENDRLLAEYIQAHKSSKADMEQVRQRLEREHERRLDVERARLAEPFVEVLENLQRLLDSCRNPADDDPLAAGASLVVKQLEDRLRAIGLQPVEAEGRPFDPGTMEALMTAEVPEDQDGLVLEVIRPGFTLGERLVRPAGVRVGVARGR